jgi:hypothetical protein
MVREIRSSFCHGRVKLHQTPVPNIEGAASGDKMIMWLNQALIKHWKSTL